MVLSRIFLKKLRSDYMWRGNISVWGCHCKQALTIACGLIGAVFSFVHAVDLYAATLALDVGHHTAAPGATSARGKPEFEFNLALAGELQHLLAGMSIPVTLMSGR